VRAVGYGSLILNFEFGWMVNLRPGGPLGESGELSVGKGRENDV
jgi:hypothetical protein